MHLLALKVALVAKNPPVNSGDTRVMGSIHGLGRSPGGGIYIYIYIIFSSVQFSPSVMSDSFQPHGLQHTRLPCPSPTPRAYSNSCPLSQRCHPTISSSVVPYSSRLQFFPASGSSPMSEFFASDSQSTGVSASASVLPMHIQYSLNTQVI